MVTLAFLVTQVSLVTPATVAIQAFPGIVAFLVTAEFQDLVVILAQAGIQAVLVIQVIRAILAFQDLVVILVFRDILASLDTQVQVLLALVVIQVYQVTRAPMFLAIQAFQVLVVIQEFPDIRAFQDTQANQVIQAIPA